MGHFQFPPHRYIEVFADANSYARHKIGLTYFPEHLIPNWVRRSLFLTHLLRPYLLAFELWRLRHNDVVIVREFITIPLLFALPATLWFRKRTLFVLNHNVQMAATRLRDRVALKALFWFCFRFIAIESEAGLREIGVRFQKSQLLVMPHGYVDATHRPRTRSHAQPIIGVIGRYRPEKSIEDLMERVRVLIQNGDLTADILVGCDHKAVLATAESYGFRTVDTTKFETYDQIFNRIDYLLLYYDRARYQYRSSAVITDAIFRRTIVICPDYPVFKTQVTMPVTVGVVYEDLDSIPDAISKAIDLSNNLDDEFDSYIQFRSSKNIATLLDDMIDNS